jgi:hypothetical protein
MFSFNKIMNIRYIFNSFVRILALQKNNINKNNYNNSMLPLYENNKFNKCNKFIYDDKFYIHFMMGMIL